MSNSSKNFDREYVFNNIVKSRILDIAQTIRKENMQKIHSDVIGSYTGLGRDYDKPVQDADDL